MIVCVCRRVSDRDIARAVKAGCTSFDGLQAQTGVATGCGACRDCARDVFVRERSALAAGAAASACPVPACTLEPA